MSKEKRELKTLKYTTLLKAVVQYKQYNHWNKNANLPQCPKRQK